jgi:hypothetical protein
LFAARAGASRRFAHGGCRNPAAICGGNAIAARTVVDDRVVITHNVVVYDRGLAMNTTSAITAYNVQTRRAITKTIVRDVVIMMVAQAEIEAEAKTV